MDNKTSSDNPGEDGASSSVKQKNASNRPFDPKNLIGETLDGRYVLEKCIGRGGMGVVYLASQSALDRKVVVKVLPPSFVDDEEAVARFEREARGMSKLQHPHIVSIYDFGYQDSQAYIVMEYVEGMTLRRLIKSDEKMSFSVFGAIALQILEGISEAHSMGMVHRDIKPSNIMLTERHGEQNYVKILDFGLAKLVKGARDVTKEQNLVGSVAFLSPEQIMGNDTDERIDVYALGVLFYYMLTGEKPFTGDDDVAVLYQHVHNDPEPLDERLGADHDIPQSVLDLIHRAMAKDPEERPHNAGQFLFEFGACIDGTAISSPHVSGEFNAVSRVAKLSNLSPDDPSDQLARQRNETPIHQIPADATPSNSGLVALGADPSSGQVTWVSGEHLLKVQQQNRLRNIMLGVLGALILGGAGFFFYGRYANVPDEQEVRADIDHAVELTDEGKFGQAENTLEMLDKQLDEYPGLQGDYAAAQDHLEIARLLSKAALYEEEGNSKKAAETYRMVLGREPGHQGARQKLRELREAKAEAEPTESDTAQSDTTQSDTAQSDTAQSDEDAAAQADPTEHAEQDSAAGSRAPERGHAAGSAQKTGGAGASKRADTSRAHAKRADATKADTKKADTKRADTKKADTKKATADKADDGLLLPSDSAQDSDSSDQGGGDLLPATEGGSDDGLLLE